MLISHSQLQEYVTYASDGEIGNMGTVICARGDWAIQYIVVNTGLWLEQRPILLSRAALDHLDFHKKQIILNLTSEQVQNSPDIDPEEPITPQEQEQLHQYYGWPTYWGTEDEDIGELSQVTEEPSESVTDEQESEPENFESAQLQSVNEIISFFNLETNDEEMGRLRDVIIDGQAWEILYLVCELFSPSGRQVLIPTEYVDRVDWGDNLIYVDFDGQTIRKSPEFEPTEGVTDELTSLVENYYGQQF